MTRDSLDPVEPADPVFTGETVITGEYAEPADSQADLDEQAAKNEAAAKEAEDEAAKVDAKQAKADAKEAKAEAKEAKAEAKKADDGEFTNVELLEAAAVIHRESVSTGETVDLELTASEAAKDKVRNAGKTAKELKQEKDDEEKVRKLQQDDPNATDTIITGEFGFPGPLDNLNPA